MTCFFSFYERLKKSYVNFLFLKEFSNFHKKNIYLSQQMLRKENVCDVLKAFLFLQKKSYHLYNLSS